MNARSTRSQSIGPHYQEVKGVRTAAIGPASRGAVWHVQVAAGDIRVVARDKLDDLLRFEVIDQNTFVWQQGMTNWVRFATLIGIDGCGSGELYTVQLAPGNIKQLTLEQLDDYYRYGVVDERTHVWQPGMPRWRTLGSLAGIDSDLPFDEAPTRVPEPPIQPFAVPMRSPRSPAQTAATVSVPAPSSARGGGVPPPPSARRAIVPPPPSARPVATTMLGTGTVAVPLRSARNVAQEQSAKPAAAPAPNPPSLLAPAASAWHTAVPAQCAQRVVQEQSVRPAAVPLQSTWPASFSVEPAYEPRYGSAMRWLLRMAVGAGVLVTLFRNDVIYSIAQRTAFARNYAELEKSYLGGPLWGTTRSVERLVVDSRGRKEPIQIPLATTQFTDPRELAATNTATSGAAVEIKDEATKPTTDPVGSAPDTGSTHAEKDGSSALPSKITAPTPKTEKADSAARPSKPTASKPVARKAGSTASESKATASSPKTENADSEAQTSKTTVSTAKTEKAAPTPQPTKHTASSPLLQQIAAAVAADKAKPSTTSRGSDTRTGSPK